MKNLHPPSPLVCLFYRLDECGYGKNTGEVIPDHLIDAVVGGQMLLIVINKPNGKNKLAFVPVTWTLSTIANLKKLVK